MSIFNILVKYSPIFTCIFGLSTTYFGIFARRALKMPLNDTVPKQCPFRIPTFWCLVCCTTCIGSRDNSKYHTYPHTYIHT